MTPSSADLKDLNEPAKLSSIVSAISPAAPSDPDNTSLNLPNSSLPLPTRTDQALIASAPKIVSNAADLCRSEEHTSELQSRGHLVCRLLLEKKKTRNVSSASA